MIDWFHPSILFIFGAILIPFLKGRLQQVYLLVIPAIAIFAVFSMTQGNYWNYTFLGNPLIFGKVDKLSVVFGWVFTIMSFIGLTYSLHVKDSGQHVAAYLYVGGSLGVTFAGDYFTLFIFWELMAFASAYLSQT
jgi:multicomponent Na+:H+ antiporter subunit D